MGNAALSDRKYGQDLGHLYSSIDPVWAQSRFSLTACALAKRGCVFLAHTLCALALAILFVSNALSCPPCGVANAHLSPCAVGVKQPLFQQSSCFPALAEVVLLLVSFSSGNYRCLPAPFLLTLPLELMKQGPCFLPYSLQRSRVEMALYFPNQTLTYKRFEIKRQLSSSSPFPFSFIRFICLSNAYVCACVCGCACVCVHVCVPMLTFYPMLHVWDQRTAAGAIHSFQCFSSGDQTQISFFGDKLRCFLSHLTDFQESFLVPYRIPSI